MFSLPSLGLKRKWRLPGGRQSERLRDASPRRAALGYLEEPDIALDTNVIIGSDATWPQYQCDHWIVR